MEKNPKFAKVCIREGHEIAAHELRWLDIDGMSVEEKAKYIKECALSMERTTGAFPKRYFYGRGSPDMRVLYPEVMKRMRKKLLYSSESCFNDDMPYLVDLLREKDLPDAEMECLLVILYNYDLNGTTYLDYLRGTFDCLYREGLNGSPKLMNIPMHSSIMGKPGRSKDLRKFMLYVKEKAVNDVWVAKREEIAEHFKENSPYVPARLAPGKSFGLGK